MDITSADVQSWVLNKATVAELSLLQELIRTKQRTQHKIGERVFFDAKTRGIVYGKITKMNAKTAKVLTDAGVQWTVDPSLLQKA